MLASNERLSMARIRSIKPDFWTDEKVVELPFEVRLFFIGSWNFADDNGNLQRSAKKLKMQIFPADVIDCEPLIQSLIAHGLLTEYSLNGEEYLHIKGFKTHQVVNRPSKSNIPEPKNDDLFGGLTEDSLTEGKGREGKGEDMSGKPDDAASVIEYLNEKANRSYQAVPANTKLIDARMREGATVDQLKAVIDAKVTEWESDPKMSAYLRPETLFGATKYAQYVGALGSRVNGHTDNPFA
jgi:uncharacterized phage protein (TIGR02220 family)